MSEPWHRGGFITAAYRFFVVLTFCGGVALAGTTYQYDAQGRLRSVTYGNGNSIVYSYDAAGNRTSVNVTAIPGSLTLSSGTYTGGEASAQRTVTLSVNRLNGAAGAASVQYATGNGTATSGSDYTAASGTLTWIAGDASPKTFTVAILDDSTFENTETFAVTLSNASGASLGSPSSATVSIADNENPPAGTLRLEAGSYERSESASAITVAVTRTDGSFGAASVNYATANGTASAGSDYTAKNGTLNWVSGDAAPKSFTITLNGDSAVEGTESFRVLLSGAAGAALGVPNDATVTLIDDDFPPRGELSFSASSYSVAENLTQVKISVRRLNGSYGVASVRFTTVSTGSANASDYNTINGTLTWPDGDAGIKEITVTILDDTVIESSETFNVVLSDAVGASLATPATATVSISDNDAPIVNIQDRSLYNTVGYPTATVYYYLTNGGDIMESSPTCSEPCIPPIDVGDWIVPKINTGAYQARAINGGCTYTTGTFDTWTTIGPTTVWGIYISTPGPGVSCTMTVQIRAAANPSVIIDSATLFINVFSGT